MTLQHTGECSYAVAAAGDAAALAAVDDLAVAGQRPQRLIPLLGLVHHCCHILGFVAVRSAHHQAIALAGSLTVQVVEHYVLRSRQWSCCIALCWHIEQRQEQMRRHGWRLFGVVIWRWHGIAVTAAAATFLLNG